MNYELKNQESNNKKLLDKIIDDFNDHQLTIIDENEFVFARPKTKVYYMHILVRLNRLIIFGDLGDWVFKNADIRSLLLQANSKDYFFGSCTTSKKEYSPEDTVTSLKEKLTELCKENELNKKDTKLFLKDIFDFIESSDFSTETLAMDVFEELNTKLNKYSNTFKRIYDDFNYLSFDYEDLVDSIPFQFNYIFFGIQAFQKRYWEKQEQVIEKSVLINKNQ